MFFFKTEQLKCCFLLLLSLSLLYKKLCIRFIFGIINFTMCCCLFQHTVMSSFPRLYRFVVWMTITMSQTLNGKKSCFFTLLIKGWQWLWVLWRLSDKFKLSTKFIVFMNREGGNLILEHQLVKPARYKINSKALDQ